MVPFVAKQLMRLDLVRLSANSTSLGVLVQRLSTVVDSVIHVNQHCICMRQNELAYFMNHTKVSSDIILF